MASFAHKLPDTTSEEELLALVVGSTPTHAVDGILVQLPLPKQIDAHAVIDDASIRPRTSTASTR